MQRKTKTTPIRLASAHLSRRALSSQRFLLPFPTPPLPHSPSPCIQSLEPRLLLSTIYVDANSPSLTPTGSSWSSAYQDLQQALTQATSGDRILVADGTYKPTPTTDRTKSFILKNNVELLGGHAGYGATDPNARDWTTYPSILSGDIGVPDDNTDNSYHVVVGSNTDNTAILDGFTITAGNASASEGGGGMYNNSGSPTIRNCTFTRNSADEDGGGMYNYWLSSPTLTNTTFSGNSAKANGGGMYNTLSSFPTLTNSVFVGNSAQYGGAIFNVDSSSTLTNSTLVANSATSGSAIYDYMAHAMTITNSILWGNTGQAIYHFLSITIRYSLIQGGYTGPGNISDSPWFLRYPSPGSDRTWGTPDDDYGDLRLHPRSPGADAADNSAVPSGLTTDLAGDPRMTDSPLAPDTGLGTTPIVDMGAYEAQAPTPLGTDGSDSFYLRRSPDGPTLDIWTSSSPAGAPAYSYSIFFLYSLTLSALDGDDTFILDLSNGPPIILGNLTLNGDGGTDMLKIIGTDSADVVPITSSTVLYSKVIHSNLESIAVDGQAGTDSVNIDAALPFSPAISNVENLNINAGIYSYGAGINGAALKIAAGASMKASDDLSVSSLNLLGSLDLAGNDLLIATGSVDAVEDLVPAGKLFTSVKTAYTGLTVASAGAGVKIKYSYNGDANQDGVVNALDYFQIDSGFLAGRTRYEDGDFNYDNVVNALDYFLIDRNPWDPLIPPLSTPLSASPIRRLADSPQRRRFSTTRISHPRKGQRTRNKGPKAYLCKSV